jgi:hypothetical protein
MRRARAFHLACAIAAAAATCGGGALVGCGGGGGISSGATVSVYVAAPLCAGAERALAQAGARASSVRVRATCLPGESAGSRLDLAVVGANARRATEDSTAVAYLEPADPAATRFSIPILESAEIGWVEASSGEAAMGRVLRAISGADSSSLRDAVREALE